MCSTCAIELKYISLIERIFNGPKTICTEFCNPQKRSSICSLRAPKMFFFFNSQKTKPSHGGTLPLEFIVFGQWNRPWVMRFRWCLVHRSRFMQEIITHPSCDVCSEIRASWREREKECMCESAWRAWCALRLVCVCGAESEELKWD